MPVYVLIVDACGIGMAIVGFLMAFRQRFVRELFGLGASRPTDSHADPDPLTYVLRIAGMMILVFGLALGLMVTLFQMV
ncbi:MAG: hypothetical protein J0I69_02530 [Altererythrobacter sp.]|nr:hypothetical protein [Altererythrobacter sp.]OJU60898.1 MAG: hypothetical protein BGO08_12280 [Altererythrobacter sp. 66-12]